MKGVRVLGKNKLKLYFTLFITMFKLSAFTFGGGYVIVPLMKKSFVDKLHLITEKEMLDYTAVAQSAPGAVAINAAILVGMKAGGVLGAAVTLVATVLPPIIILSIISLVYEAFAASAVVAAVLRGMRAGICAVIADVVISLTWNILKKFDKKNPLDIIRAAIMPTSFILVFVFKINSAFVVLGAAALGIVIAFLTRKGGEEL